MNCEKEKSSEKLRQAKKIETKNKKSWGGINYSASKPVRVSAS